MAMGRLGHTAKFKHKRLLGQEQHIFCDCAGFWPPKMTRPLNSVAHNHQDGTFPNPTPQNPPCHLEP
ncbi:uncharacterized protein BDR25DRAFT_347818 [Lindgomyces ingoldianus]|uniref:Uncharacterized protein n=1 Tax=Lindgomyces ingoldianus TaxID=673940 RepID=A0ACB6RDV5_9PLEO|nr:uncharacterized protein BDR25DRAFT_347818 [Lindgomyces ingoldianus]KAF2477463.1 hypothetical protein BDR25DRAFT_347818 [Lindgomyces ingoldianus]